MANAKVPLKFQIFRGDEIIREEELSEPVIKVGKLASSHLRLEDDSVSRMHAVVEVNGPDDVATDRPRVDPGTLVNGERITKVRLHAGDEINFGDVRVIVAFLDQEEATVVAPHVSAAAAAHPQARPWRRLPPSTSRRLRRPLTRPRRTTHRRRTLLRAALRRRWRLRWWRWWRRLLHAGRRQPGGRRGRGARRRRAIEVQALYGAWWSTPATCTTRTSRPRPTRPRAC
jgi:pSer/pThr/pTyr-binding forkhead associated (FHA) protein